MTLNKKTPPLKTDLGFVLDPARPAAEQISSALRDSILSLTLAPGRMISEAELGQHFGASRTPVREAFKQLSDEGLLVSYPSRGTYVTKLSVSQITGAQFLREAVEIAVVNRLCDMTLPDETKDRIRRNLDAQERAIAAVDGPGFYKLDDQFHTLLANAVALPRIADILLREKTCLDRLRMLALGRRAEMALLLDDHRQIYDAIKTGQKSGARNATKRHLRRVLDTLSDLKEANCDFFVSQDHELQDT